MTVTAGVVAAALPHPGPDDPDPDAAIRSVEGEMAALFARSREYKRRAAASLHPSLQPAGYGLLRLLSTCGPTRASALAEQLDVDRSAVTRLAQALESLGLIERLPDVDDGRAALLALSPNGQERIAAVRRDHQAVLRRSFADWPTDDIARFAELLGRFNASDDLDR